MTQATLPQMIKTTFLTDYAKNLFWAGGLLVLLAASDSFADNHKANQTAPSEFSIAVKAIKEKQYQEGLDIFLKLAEAGDAEAQYNVSVLLRSGRGRPQNYRDSYYWAVLSLLGKIEQAEDIAEEIEAKLADGEKEDILEEVKTFLHERIDNGFLDTIPQLAAYHVELLEEPDYETAYLWYTVATALNISEMLELRDDTEDELEAEQISNMQAQASEIFDKIVAGETIIDKETTDESESQVAN